MQMLVADIYLSRFRCISGPRFLAYILISALATASYRILSFFVSLSTSLTCALPLLAGYASHELIRRYFHQERSLHYCVFVSTTLLILGDASQLIKRFIVPDPSSMTDVHLAVMHSSLAFAVVSDIEFWYCLETKDAIPYPDVLCPPYAHREASRFPGVARWQDCDWSIRKSISLRTHWKALAPDIVVCLLWPAVIWSFNSRLRLLLNPEWGSAIRVQDVLPPYGYGVLWTPGNCICSCVLQNTMSQPVRAFVAHIFAFGIDALQWMQWL